MFAVIFEVRPKRDRWDEYLELAKQLRPKLETIDGFIDNERFGSKKTEGLVLSLSTWRDEKSVVRWRTNGGHHGIQTIGRSTVFADYHLRVGEITSDTAPPEGFTVEERRFDETEAGAAKICTITEVSPPEKVKSEIDPERVVEHLQLDPRSGGLLDHEVFESITKPGKILILASWLNKLAASGWTPAPLDNGSDVRHRLVRVIRDYGMFDRREAPQFYPEIRNEAAGDSTR
jgi:heme-degrading monooxygenase HmoA